MKAFFISLLIFLALISAGGYFGYQYVQSSLLPVDANSKEYVTVQIPEGSNVQEIGSTLEHSGVIKHGVIFAFYAKYKNYSDLKAGYYNLQKSMSTEDIIKELQKGGTPEPQAPSLANLTIPEGYTIDQIAQAVGQLQGEFKDPLTADAFLAKVQLLNIQTYSKACQRKKVELVTVWKVIFSQRPTLSRKAQLLKA